MILKLAFKGPYDKMLIGALCLRARSCAQTSKTLLQNCCSVHQNVTFSGREDKIFCDSPTVHAAAKHCSTDDIMLAFEQTTNFVLIKIHKTVVTRAALFGPNICNKSYFGCGFASYCTALPGPLVHYVVSVHGEGR